MDPEILKSHQKSREIYAEILKSSLKSEIFAEILKSFAESAEV